MDLASTIRDEMRRIGAEHKKPVAKLDDDTPLTATGLDSLGFAVLVARLEEKLRVDPFSASGDLAFPVTVGDLIAFYEGALVRA